MENIMMWALVKEEPEEGIWAKRVPVPDVGYNDVKIRILKTAICGTDVRMWQNGASGVDAEHPLVLGHEFAGTIVRTGKNVPFYKAGMQVGMQPNIGCGICERICPSGAAKVQNNLSRIDDGLCLSCGQCLVACPRGVIADVRGILSK